MLKTLNKSEKIMSKDSHSRNIFLDHTWDSMHEYRYHLVALSISVEINLLSVKDINKCSY